MNNTKLDTYVAQYINAFEADIMAFDKFKTNYNANVEHRVTEVMYTPASPENFVDKCNTQLHEVANEIYPLILAKKVAITLKHVMHHFFYNDLKTLFEQGYTVVSADPRRLILQRPDSLFKGADEAIQAMYDSYVTSETAKQKEAYLDLALIDEYVTQCEDEERKQALAAKQKALVDTVNKLTQADNSEVEQSISKMVKTLDTVTTAAIREELSLTSDDITDRALSAVLKLAGFEKKRTNSGNVWNKLA